MAAEHALTPVEKVLQDVLVDAIYEELCEDAERPQMVVIAGWTMRVCIDYGTTAA